MSVTSACEQKNDTASPASAPATGINAQGFAEALLVQMQTARQTGDSDAVQTACAALATIGPKLVQLNATDTILRLCAQFELSQCQTPQQIGQFLSDLLGTLEGRAQLREHLDVVTQDSDDSLFLFQLRMLCAALAGDYRQAASCVSDRIVREQQDPELAGDIKRHNLLQELWNRIDKIAFIHVDWSSDEQAKQASLDEAATTTTSFDRERLLQSRRQEDFLQLCLTEFEAAETLAAQLRFIRQMLRVGLRRLPDYSDAHQQAGACLDIASKRIRSWLLKVKPEQAVRPGNIQQLVLALELSRKLKRNDLAKDIIARMIDIASLPDPTADLWQFAANVATTNHDRAAARTIMTRTRHCTPKTEAHLRDFFRWSNLCGEYDEAVRFAASLPKKFERSFSLLHFVETLQRLSRFEQALELAGHIHAEMLSRPWLLRPAQNETMITRIGELEFLRQTARILNRIPTPREPRGVIMLMPRNVGQLRSYPLMTLRAFKARGWAIVPLVEGLLPRETTGIAEIDLLHSCITKQADLDDAAEAAMGDLTDFNVDLDSGHASWGKIDLSHALWEEAAINRRRHSVIWGCPELQSLLSRLMEWSRSSCRAIEYAHKFHRRSGMRVGIMSRFNHRLPDCIPRFYCDQFGDADGFFCLQGANGYQNYFTNFSTNISQRFVVRNMTRHPEVRSASFPTPDNFERYYQAHRDQAHEILLQHENVTKVKRSTGDQKTPPPEAVEASRKIEEWRARGGKVACAFGKVVFDSGVPFDGGPTHRDMKDWINHCIRTVRGSDTLLLIKPHPHELNNQISTFPTEYFRDLIEEPMDQNVMFLGHRWFDINDMRTRMDLGLIYNGTTSVELGIMGIPCILAGHFAPIDYPIGHAVPDSRAEFEQYLRFEKPTVVAPDIRERAAVWLHYMASDDFTLPYRFHARPVTNKTLYPPYWFQDDLRNHEKGIYPVALRLMRRALGHEQEPGGI